MSGLVKPTHPFKVNRETENIVLLSRDLATRAPIWYSRPTEIEYINGKIVKIGRMFNNIDVDLNMFFTSAIVTQEIRNGTRDEEDIPDYLVNS